MFARKTIAGCAGLALILASGLGAWAKPAARGEAYRRTGHLLMLMDRDHNGAVSKDEFMRFMAREFDRVDADRSGGLTAREFSHSHLADHSGARRDVSALVRLLDADHNGIVTRDEFIAFMSAEFDRVDADRSGNLTREELSNSIFVHPQQSHPGGTRK